MTNKSRKLNESDHPNVLEATGSDKEIGKKPGVRSNRENEEEVGKSGFRKWDGIRDERNDSLGSLILKLPFFSDIQGVH